MAVALTKSWDAAVEKNMRDFYDTLSEKDRRRFAAVQARQFGYGGVRYMAEVLAKAATFIPGILSGAVPLLVKPFTSDALIARVKALLAQVHTP